MGCLHPYHSDATPYHTQQSAPSPASLFLTFRGEGAESGRLYLCRRMVSLAAVLGRIRLR